MTRDEAIAWLVERDIEVTERYVNVLINQGCCTEHDLAMDELYELDMSTRSDRLRRDIMFSFSNEHSKKNAGVEWTPELQRWLEERVNALMSWLLTDERIDR